jgi:hypothetical protein
MQAPGIAIELDSKVVGIAVRTRSGFVFFSSDDRFNRLDGEVFPRSRAILSRLREIDDDNSKPLI